MRGCLAAGAAIKRIIRRRLQAGGGTDAALAAIDGGIEQFRQGSTDRPYLGAVCFRFRRFAALFGIVRFLRHRAEYGMSLLRGKGQKAGCCSSFETRPVAAPRMRATGRMVSVVVSIPDAVIPGRCEASNPESRDSGPGADAPSRNDELCSRPPKLSTLRPFRISRKHISRNLNA
jgi:hypothetical protein